jgi:parallel beta-helix repeat protein
MHGSPEHADSRPNSDIWIRHALLAFVCALALPAMAATYYVAPSGNDYGSGLWVSTPFKTIQKAMNVAVAGDTVFIRGGVYREKVEVLSGGGAAGKPVKVQNYNGEQVYIKGSQPVTGWIQHSGSIWKKTGWTVNSQQVFVDFNDASPTSGPKPLQQIGMPSTYYTSWEYNAPVGTGLSSMRAGSFFYDKGAQTLYVWLADGSSPNNHRMEASVQRRLFYLGRPYIEIDGLKFRHSNVSGFGQQGAAVELSSNSTLRNCDIQFVDFAGVSMGYLQSNTSVVNCNISNNGNSGVNASATNNFRVAYNKLNSNNYRNFNLLWHAGGFKAATKAYGTVEANVVAYNNGSGVWFDYANSGQPIVIRNNLIQFNGPKDSGIFFEVSKNALIYNNIIVNNSRRGIYISASDNNRIFNNTIANTSGYAGVDLGGMPRSGATLTNNQVMNNIISGGTSTYDLLIKPANGTTIKGNVSNNNNVYRSSGVKLWYGTMYYSLTNWQKASGQDSVSTSVDPRFVVPSNNPPAAANFKLQSGSPLINKGRSLAGVVNADYVATPRPQSTAFDMGAFEFK